MDFYHWESRDADRDVPAAPLLSSGLGDAQWKLTAHQLIYEHKYFPNLLFSGEQKTELATVGLKDILSK